MKIVFLLSFSLFFLCRINVFGQELISSTGGHITKNDIQISWAIGEPVIETFQNNNLILTQGVHQPLLVVTFVNEIPESSLFVSAYPNPTQDKVNIRINNSVGEELMYSLFDLNGKLLVESKIIEDITTVSMINYAPATYLLKIGGHSNSIKTFQIVKTR